MNNDDHRLCKRKYPWYAIRLAIWLSRAPACRSLNQLRDTRARVVDRLMILSCNFSIIENNRRSPCFQRLQQNK